MITTETQDQAQMPDVLPSSRTTEPTGPPWSDYLTGIVDHLGERGAHQPGLACARAFSTIRSGTSYIVRVCSLSWGNHHWLLLVACNEFTPNE